MAPIHHPTRFLRVTAILSATLLAGACTGAGQSRQLETLVPGSALHAPNGLNFGPDGSLYAGSVGAQKVYRIDPFTAKIETVITAPEGEADDVAFAPDGTLLWTALVAGEIRALRNGSVTVVAEDFALINPIDFSSDGRMFASQIGFDRLYEFPLDANLTPTGAPRLIASGIGNLNSFEIAADNLLYGPLVDKGEVVTIDIDTGAVAVIASGLGRPVAVNLDPAGNVWAIDWVSGNLWRIDRLDPASGWAAPQRVATLEPPLDNLAIGPDGAVYVSRTPSSAIDRVDPDTGAVTPFIEGHLASVGGIAITTHEGRETLLVADGYGFRLTDTQSGAVSAPYDLTAFGFPAAASAAAANDEYFAFTDVVTRPSVYLVDRASGATVAKWRDIRTALGILLTTDGNPLVTDYATGTLLALERTDRKARRVVAADLAGPVGLAWAEPAAEQTAVYVAESQSGTIVRISLDDNASRTTVATGLKQPEGITLLADGRIAVVEVGTRQLLAVDPADGSREILATGLPVGNPSANAPPPVHLPSGVAEGIDGTLYISGDNDNSIRMLAR